MSSLRAAAVPGLFRSQVQRASESLAALLGLEPGALPSLEHMENILDGRRAEGSVLPEDRAAMVRARVLALYGFHGNREPNAEERENLLAGQRADGSAPGRAALLDGLSATRSRIGYVDLCWSADKSVRWPGPSHRQRRSARSSPRRTATRWTRRCATWSASSAGRARARRATTDDDDHYVYAIAL